jgi:murein DD-endopeptidase MepM/ murein hydrolase activator NlpD
VAARFQNAPFLADLLKVLNHPVSAQTPDLKHFRLEAERAAAVRAEAGRAGRAAQDNRTVTALFTIVALVAMGAAGAGLWVARFRIPRQARHLGLLLVPAVAMTLATGLRPQPVRPTSIPPVEQVARAVPVPTPRAASVLENAPAWQELVAVERDLIKNQDMLARQEDLIRKTAANPVASSPGGAPSADATPAQVDSIRLDGAARQEARMARLLDAYHEATARYQDSLRQEYELYRGAAKDPSRRQQLVAAAAAAPAPEVRDAVSYNLAVVQAALDQEAQISAAEGKLQALGSLSGAQLEAIRKHQAFITPVQAQVVQGFGSTDVGFEPSASYHGTFYPHFHSGLDFAAPENTPVHAAADGIVLLATSSRDSQGNLIGYGNYVVIAHPNGFVTLYGHLNGFSVKEGQVVHQGEIVGQEGSTGLSTGPHVHFEIRHNNEWVDPAPYLAGQVNT